jgi:hypothetical protein
MKKTRIPIILIVFLVLGSLTSYQSLAQQASLPWKEAHDYLLTSAPAAPDPFTKVSPGNASTNQPISNLVLSWNASSPGVNYQYCLRTSNKCPEPKWVTVGPYTQVTVPVSLSPNTLYYWWVRAVDAQGNTTGADGGAYWTFTTVQNVTVPGAFSKVAPTDTATSQPINGLVLSWNASSLAASYQYCYDTNPNSTCDTSWTSTNQLTASLGGLSYNTVYYWQVRAVNANGNTQADGGDWWSFTTQLAPPGAFGKSAPANLSAEQLTSVTLAWGASAGAGITYEYCFATTACSPSSTWVSAGTNLSVGLNNLQYGTTYYWQVRAMNTAATVYADSDTNWSFSTKIAPPQDFGKTSPGNNTTNLPLSLTLMWGTSPGTNVQYEYCFGTAACTPASTWLVAGTSTSASISGLAYATTYYWQVRAVNSTGMTYANANDASPVWQFSTQSAPPQPFAKLSPAATGTEHVSVNTTLQWSASAGASRYFYCVDTVSHPDNDNTCGTGWVQNATTESPHLNLAYNVTYYWQVYADNSQGTLLADNGAWFHFTTSASQPSDFSKITPDNAVNDQSLTPWLYWWTPPGDNTYQFCFETSSGCPGGVWTPIAENTPIHITTPLLHNTTYYWQVRAIANVGGAITYANSNTEWSFKTIQAPPTCSNQTFNNAVENTLYTATITNATSSYTKVFSLYGSMPAGTLLLSENGSFSYMPVQYFNGAVTFQFMVSDGYNIPAGPCTATIEVKPVNNPPVLSSIADQSVLVGKQLTFWVQASDPDLSYGDVLTYSVEGTLPSGASINSQTGFFRWLVPVNQPEGTYNFTFQVSDGGGLSASQVVKIRVNYLKVYLPLIMR